MVDRYTERADWTGWADDDGQRGGVALTVPVCPNHSVSAGTPSPADDRVAAIYPDFIARNS